MKPWIWLGLLLFCVPARADQRSDLYSDLPETDWSVVALKHLAELGLFGKVSPESLEVPLSRYEVAAGAARIINNIGFEPQFAPDSGIDARSVRDTLAALLFEYRDEYTRLGPLRQFFVGTKEIEAYFRVKKKQPLDATAWYSLLEGESWESDKDLKEWLVKTTPRFIPPPRLVIKPTPTK